MTDVVWRQNPSLLPQTGRLLVVGIVCLALAAGRWWLPLLSEHLGLSSNGLPLQTIADWMPLFLLVALLQVGRAWLGTRRVRYELTAERLLITTGLLSERVDNLELYRVREMHLDLPLVSRLMGVGTIVLETIDHTEPEVVLRGIRQPREIFERIRNQVEGCRRRAGVSGLS